MKKQIISRGVLLLAVIIVLSGCATMPIGKSQEGMSEKTQAIVYREQSPADFIIEYSVQRIIEEGKGARVEFVDPAKDYICTGNEVGIFFRVEIFNPTGKIITLKVNVEQKKEKKKKIFSGGNTPNTVLFYHVPLPSKNEEVRMWLEFALEGNPNSVETLILNVKRKEE